MKKLRQSLKKIVLIGAVLAGVVFAVVNQFGSYFPDVLQGLVHYIRSNLIVSMTTVAFGMVLGSAAVYLLVQSIVWAYSHMQGLTFRAHLTAIGFSLINTLIMGAVAAYVGYPIVCYVAQLINFTVIPQSYSVYGALAGAIILFFIDYRASAYKKYWMKLIIMHVLCAIVCAFAFYIIVFIAIIVVLSLIMPPLLRLLDAYGEVHQAFFESYFMGSTQEAMAFADAMMHSSIGWMCVLEYMNNRSER